MIQSAFFIALVRPQTSFVAPAVVNGTLLATSCVRFDFCGFVTFSSVECHESRRCWIDLHTKLNVYTATSGSFWKRFSMKNHKMKWAKVESRWRKMDRTTTTTLQNILFFGSGTQRVQLMRGLVVCEVWLLKMFGHLQMKTLCMFGCSIEQIWCKFGKTKNNN